jgi:hypothetical protein
LSRPAAAPYLWGWYQAGDTTVHVSTGLYELAEDAKPTFATGEYGLLLELTLTAYHD